MVKYWTVPPEWTDETCFILAGGPSLRGFSVGCLREQGRVLVINQSYQLAPDADVLYFCDSKWWREHEAGVRELFTGRYIVTLENQIDGAKTLRNTGPTGLEMDPSGLRTGSNSGYQAINLAYHFGAKRIVLLGYDMRVAGPRTHWHGGYTGQTPADFGNTLARVMLPKFLTLVRPLYDAGIEVLNATPRSALSCWPNVPLDLVFKLRSPRVYEARRGSYELRNL